MAIAALITWVITAVGGFVMLGSWVSRGGHRGGNTRLAPTLVFSHFGLAAVGLVLWIVYLVTSNATLAWVSFVLLLPVALLGFTMFARWWRSRHDTTSVDASLPTVIVLAHGLFAATTLVLVLLAALAES